MSTTSIKATYNTTSRRFSIPTDSPNWLELERKIRVLFQITVLKINVSYIDEDGDEITVSSDLELEEILKQFTYNNKNNPIKLIVTTPETSNTSTTSTSNAVTTSVNVIPNSIDESWVIEGDNYKNEIKSSSNNNNNNQQSQKNTITPYEIAGSGNDNSTATSTINYQHASFVDESEEEDKETLLPFDKKETLEKIDPANKNKNIDTENNRDGSNKQKLEAGNEEDDEFIIYITSHHPWLNSIFCGSDLNRGGYNKCNGRYNFYGPQPQFCRQRFNYRKFNNNENEVRNNNNHNHNNGGCSYKSCYNRAAFENATTEEEKVNLSNKIKILNEMGFPEAKNPKYEILLRKFNGNIERVVDVLLYWQKDNYCGANECGKNKIDKENNGSDSSSSSSNKKKEVEETH